MSFPPQQHCSNCINKIEQYDDFLVTIGKERIEGFIRLCNIVTSETQPLTIMCFVCWVQFEDDVPLLKFCSPTTAIVCLQDNDRPNMAFHKRERVDIQSLIWPLFTSEKEPLIFKESKVTVYIDDEKHKEIVGCTTIEQVIKVASQGGQRLCPTVVDKSGRKVEDLGIFILDTSSSS